MVKYYGWCSSLDDTMKRKGFIFSPLLVLIVIVILFSAYYILRDKTDVAKQWLGEDIIAITHDGHDKLEKGLLTQDYLAEVTANRVAFGLLRNGGVRGEKDEEICGKYPQEAAGFFLWSQKDRTLEECIPPWKENFIAVFDKEFKQQTTTLRETHPDIIWEFRNFEYSLLSNPSALVGVNLEKIEVKNIGDNLPVSLYTPGNFKAELFIDLVMFQNADDGLKKLITDCSQTGDPRELEKCVTSVTKTLTTEQVEWKFGKVCGKDSAGDRYVLFCLDPKKKYIFEDADYSLNFAAYIPQGVDFQIVEFKVNDILAEEGMTFAGIDPTSISYSGKITFAAPITVEQINGGLIVDESLAKQISFSGSGAEYSFTVVHGPYTPIEHSARIIITAGEIQKSGPLVKVKPLVSST